MRTVAFTCAVAACAGGADAFVGPSMRPGAMRRASGSVRMASEVTVPELLKQTERLKLLSTASKLGLLSKLEKAGLSLKDVEKLLPLVDENDLIGLAKGAAPDLLKIAPKALAAAPAALPLLATALGIPGEALYLAALASFGAGAALVTVLPDDTVTGVALETFIAIPLLFVLPAVCAGGGFALSSLKNGSLVNFLTSTKFSSPAPVQSSAPASFAFESAPKAAKAAVGGGAKSSGGRPMAVSTKKVKAAPAAAPKAAPKKAAPKPAPKPRVVGNISNLPKAL